MTAVGYIRRSHAGEAEVSEKVQRQAIARLAEERGLTVDRMYMDWGRTGRLPDDVDGDTLPEILDHRPKALELMRAIEDGAVGTVLAYRQDRLARDSFTLQLMMRVARRHRVPLIIPRGDITAREQRLLTAVEGGMDEEEGTRAKERGGAANATIIERGDDRGGVPYGWSRLKLAEDGVNSKGEPAKAGAYVYRKTDPEKPAHVVEVFREVGSYNAAARRLNAEGLPPPNPKQRRGQDTGPEWSATSVRDIIRREAPDLTRRVTGTPRTPRSFLLRGILRCHCGAPMTASTNPRGIEYYCNRGKRNGHRPYGISERKLLPWIRDEADRLTDPDEYTETVGEYDDSDQRRRLEAARDLIGEDAYGAALAKLDAEAAKHGERRERLLDVPDHIDWERWSTEDINRALLGLWRYVELGPDLLPFRAKWREPGLRA